MTIIRVWSWDWWRLSHYVKVRVHCKLIARVTFYPQNPSFCWKERVESSVEIWNWANILLKLYNLYSSHNCFLPGYVYDVYFYHNLNYKITISLIIQAERLKTNVDTESLDWFKNWSSKQTNHKNQIVSKTPWKHENAKIP